MIDVKNMRKSFGDHLVLDDISEHISPGEKVVVIGPSGSGKSTFLRCLNLLETPTSGSITFQGQEITDPKADINAIRRQMGMVFQHFNLFPNMTIRKNITLAPVRTKLMTQEEADETATALLKRVNLEEKADAYPAQLSGGQKQRIAIVRALAMKPDVMLFDEPTSALDVSVQAQVLNLMQNLQREVGLTYLFISHNLSVVHHISDRVGVMYLGRLVELTDKRTLFTEPRHPYTRMLLEAIPDMTQMHKKRTPVAGEVPNPLKPPSGCAFHPRCPYATERCKREVPQMKFIDSHGSTAEVACHAVEERRI